MLACTAGPNALPQDSVTNHLSDRHAFRQKQPTQLQQSQVVLKPSTIVHIVIGTALNMLLLTVHLCC